MNGIKKNRKARNMSQQQLANALGIAQSTVAMWETGKRIPCGGILQPLAQILGCTIDELFAAAPDGKEAG